MGGAEQTDSAGRGGIMKEIRGIAASSGKVKGEVKVVFSEQDFTRFKPGMVLVTRATNPAWTPLIAIAKAVVTDLGGSLSHAAIVSREFGIPCVVGTRTATEVLKDGDEVEVDAEKGVVRRLEK